MKLLSMIIINLMIINSISIYLVTIAVISPLCLSGLQQLTELIIWLVGILTMGLVLIAKFFWLI